MIFLSKIRAWLYGMISEFSAWKYRTLYHMEIGEGTQISRKAKLDTGANPKGIHIGSYVRITGGGQFYSLMMHVGKRKAIYI